MSDITYTAWHTAGDDHITITRDIRAGISGPFDEINGIPTNAEPAQLASALTAAGWRTADTWDIRETRQGNTATCRIERAS